MASRIKACSATVKDTPWLRRPFGVASLDDTYIPKENVDVGGNLRYVKRKQISVRYTHVRSHRAQVLE